MAYDYDAFMKDVFRLTKIDLTYYKQAQMKRRIDALITKSAYKDYQGYAAAISGDKKLLDEFVEYITINVSEFYRNPEQWEILTKRVFPELIEKFGDNLNIWSAACSTGDEPYSLVMALSKHIPLNQIKIYATDIDKQVLAQAKTGIYAEKSLAGVPKEFKTKYFTKVGNSYQISNEIKSRVEFKEGNLLKDRYPVGCHFII